MAFHCEVVDWLHVDEFSVDDFRKAVCGSEPVDACMLTVCGNVLRGKGELADAAKMYEKALEADPSDKFAKECLALVYTELGNELNLDGISEDAKMKYHQAVEVDPHCGRAHHNLGVFNMNLVDYDNALLCFKQAAMEMPMCTEPYGEMAVIHMNREELEKAIECYERCVKVSLNSEIANNMAIALTDLGKKLTMEGDFNKAIECYKKALFYDGHYADAMYNLGVACAELKNIDMAVQYYKLALHFNPRCEEAYNNLGVISRHKNDLKMAEKCYQWALDINPRYPEAINNLGDVYKLQGHMDLAQSMLEKSIHVMIALHPTFPNGYNSLGSLHRDAGDVSLAIENYKKCLELDPDFRDAGHNKLLVLNYINDGSNDSLQKAHREWGRSFMKLYEEYTSWENTKDADRPLVIGYVSPDFCTHSVSYFIEAPLKYHDYENHKVVVYSAVMKADDKTKRFKETVLEKKGLWRDIYKTDERELASMVREDKIDILLELAGHTANNTLGLMACHPAPVQVTWIGYPNTTGLPTIDYRITDALADPPDTKQEHVEKLVRLPDSFLCYTPSPDAGSVCKTPALVNGFVTFGSFNHIAKITGKVLQVWVRILDAVPNSQLIVKCKPFSREAAKQTFMERLGLLGLNPVRVKLLPQKPSNIDHMQSYSELDISLDTFPYAGTTTTCESLYMGVPCVTMRGPVHAHNVGVSLLKAIGGLDDYIAENEDEYVQCAISVASDIKVLSSLRMKLRDRMVKSPLCDGSKFTQGLESAYREMWLKYCAKTSQSSAQESADHVAENGKANGVAMEDID